MKMTAIITMSAVGTSKLFVLWKHDCVYHMRTWVLSDKFIVLYVMLDLGDVRELRTSINLSDGDDTWDSTLFKLGLH